MNTFPNKTIKKIAAFLAKLSEKSESVYCLSSIDFKTIYYVSSVYEKIWGRSCKALYVNSESWFESFHPDELKTNLHFSKIMTEKIKKIGKAARYEMCYRIIRPDGEIRWISSRAFPIFDEQDHCCGITTIAIDHSQEKMNAANQLKTEFLKNIHHDILTPLSGITGCASLIRIHANDSKKVKDYATDLINSSHALLQFLNQFLEKMQQLTGEISVLTKKFNLCHVLKQVIRLSEAKAEVKNIGLRFSYDINIPPAIPGDPLCIQRIALELMTNALKYTNRGEIYLSAVLIKNEKKDQIIKLAVCDTGIGIPSDQHREIFAPFKRLQPTLPGKGLGLATVKTLVEELGGEIHLESELNLGSTFTCLIPVKRSLAHENEIVNQLWFEENNDMLTEKKATAVSLKAGSETRTRRVLIVEDNLIATKVAQVIFQSFHFQNDTAREGETVLDLVEKNYYDLILMDIGLPSDDGCDITRRIRLSKAQCNPSVPIIGITAHLLEEKKQYCLEQGMNAVYYKPFTPEKALEIIKRYISPSEAFFSKSRGGDFSNRPLDTLLLLDKEKALQLLDSKETLQELLQLFVNGLTDEIIMLKQHYQAHNWQGIGALAHKWKGGASYCGASRLEYICKQIGIGLSEKLVKKLDILYQHLLQVVEETYEAAKKAIS